VARAFAAAQERDGEVRLRLSPPELGSLRLRVQVQDGALVARLEAETSAARTALIDNLPALRERLAEQGVRIERFDVDLMQRHGGGTPDRPGGQQRDVEPLVRPAPLPRPSSASAAIATDHSVVPPAGSGRLNVVV
jgi:flagellar hook-length control protein FliK